MCEVCTYPTQEDVKVCKSAVSLFLTTRNGASRNVMHGVLKAMLDRYNISKISLPAYIVERGRQGGVRIIPRIYTEERTCPKCGASIYAHGSVAIISIIEGEDAHAVTYGCECGNIFGKWEENA